MSRRYGQSKGAGDAYGDNAGIGAVTGFAAFAVNYVLVFVFVTLDGVESSGAPLWKLVGLTHYAAHFVETSVAVTGADTTGSATVNLLDASSLTGQLATVGSGTPSGVVFDGWFGLTSAIPAVAYYLTPAVVLVVAGYLVANQAQSRMRRPASAAVGASIATGYLVLSIAGVFLFAIKEGVGDVSLSVQPELLGGILLMGVVYPLLLGAIGGAIANGS